MTYQLANARIWDGSAWVASSTKVAATGGTETTETIGGLTYRVHTFTTSANFVVTAFGIVELLIVGGGGGGGRSFRTPSGEGHGGGGGGAGGVVSVSFFAPVGTHAVVVGAGGVAMTVNATQGTNGEASSIFGIAGVGGGRGGASSGGGGGGVQLPGGSGGGAGRSGGGGAVGQSGVPTQGNSGGNTQTSGESTGGGGGGADSAGDIGTSDLSSGGAGGAGITTDFDGSSKTYGVGGNGGRSSGGAAGTNGLGNGGSGANISASNDTISASFAGGDGIVIVRYRL